MAHIGVIGGGAAGMWAARAARRRGARVTLVRRSAGASALSSGAADLPCLRSADGARLDPRSTLEALPRVLPSHPLSRVRSAAPDQDAWLSEAWALMTDGDAPFSNGWMQLATPLGSVHEAWWAAPPVASGRLDVAPDERRAVVGVRGWGGSDPMATAQGLASRGIDAVPVWIELGLRADAQIHELATLLDSPEVWEPAATRIAHAARQAGARHVLVPAAGAVRPEGLLAALEGLGLRAGELPGTSPSVPGARWDRQWRTLLDRSGAQVVTGEVTRFEAASAGGGPLDVGAVWVGDHRIEADAWILATGRFLGGGIRHDGVFRETVFGLPVLVDGADPGDRWLGSLLSGRPGDPQPALSAGVGVDADGLPVDAWGRRMAANVFPTGVVAGGFDLARGEGGLGVAALLSVAAAESAVRRASRMEDR